MAGAWAPHALSTVESAQSERDRRPPYISLLCEYIRKRPSFAKSSNMFFHIKQHLILIIFCEIATNVQATVKSHSVDSIKKSLEEHQGHLLVNKSKTNSVPLKIANVSQIGYDPPKKKKKNDTFKPITLHLIQEWAKEISNILYENENLTVRRDVLLKGFTDVKIETRNGTAIVEKAARALEELLERRGRAAEAIMRKAEELATNNFLKKEEPPSSYTYTKSIQIDEQKELKPPEETPDEKGKEWDMLENCTNRQRVVLTSSKHFDAKVSLEQTSVHVAAEVFECDPRVVKHIYWTEGLVSTFRDNYAKDATLDLQYMCSAKGFLRHYPAALWPSLYKLKVSGEEVYDCRLRPWYVSAGGAPRDVLILVDASGSMSNSSNRVVAEKFTLALLSALTDDDQVNVVRFNVKIHSSVPCFNEKLVPANHVNSGALMSMLQYEVTKNESLIAETLEYAVQLLMEHRLDPARRPSCQQAIIMLTDSLYENFTDLMRSLDPEGSIRLFVLWLHDRFGLRDNTRLLGESMSCDRDGYFAEMVTHADVTQQVMNILRVMERPLVAQRKHRLRVYGDVYANVEDPRRSEYYWQLKENVEQVFRYSELRKNKDQFLATARQGDYLHMAKLEKYGQYYEGEDVNYRLQISVSVPVFESTTIENITITLDEEKQRNSTRTYPVNRLLGVAGVDIPIDHLKLILPYYLVGAGGSLSIVDHRGNIVIHDNAKPVFDGDILKPGYRTVDFLDVEQPAKDHAPRQYPEEWLDFRNSLVINETSGHRTMDAKSIFEGGMRVILEKKEYYWRRVMDQYTVVAALPKYNKRHAVPESAFTQRVAEEAWKALNTTEFSVHPDWLYCQHVDPHFEYRQDEVLHFIERRKNATHFPMRKITHLFTRIKPTVREQTYQCNEELMARLSKEAAATYRWMLNEEAEETCAACKLGSTVAFFAGESGLMRWLLYRATSQHAQPPERNVWSRGPEEPWYRRAAAAPDRLVIHAPVAPIRVLRNSDASPPPLGEKWYWLTAARTLGHPVKGVVGVTGYHFYPQHLRDVLNSYTNIPCPEGEEDMCEPHCDGELWVCLLIDDGGWIVSTNEEKEETDDEDEEPITEHLANAHPAAMSALLNAGIFKLRWVHDYQAVCFPPAEEDIISAASIIPSLVRSVWNSVQLLIHVSREFITLITILTSCGFANSETEKEKEKRRNKVRKDFEREKYERLYDPRVIVNRTRFAACDRSRALYEFQRNPKSMELLQRAPSPCKWPLIGTELPGTNLLLLAVYNNCTYLGKPVNNPFYNQLVPMDDADEGRVTIAGRMACLRNRVPLPARAPHSQCFPHNYSQEAGYRQCGPWLPDPDTASAKPISNLILFLICVKLLITLFY